MVQEQGILRTFIILKTTVKNNVCYWFHYKKGINYSLFNLLN